MDSNCFIKVPLYTKWCSGPNVTEHFLGGLKSGAATHGVDTQGKQWLYREIQTTWLSNVQLSKGDHNRQTCNLVYLHHSTISVETETITNAERFFIETKCKPNKVRVKTVKVASRSWQFIIGIILWNTLSTSGFTMMNITWTAARWGGQLNSHKWSWPAHKFTGVICINILTNQRHLIYVWFHLFSDRNPSDRGECRLNFQFYDHRVIAFRTKVKEG